MTTVERRLEQLETRLHSRKLRDVRDVTELSSVELALHLLDDFALLDAPELADRRRYILAQEWLCEDSLADPLERYAAHLLRTVIWGHDNEALDGPTRDAAPLLAEQYRGRFHESVCSRRKAASVAAYRVKAGCSYERLTRHRMTGVSRSA